MMKLRRLAISLTALSALSMVAMAPAHQLMPRRLSVNHAIGLIKINTYNDQAFHPDEFVDYVGYSTSNPCSDLAVIDQYSVPPSVECDMYPGEYEITSQDIEDTLAENGLMGPITCIKTDVRIHGQLYSTGNVKIIFDQRAQRYTRTIPSVVTINVK